MAHQRQRVPIGRADRRQLRATIAATAAVGLVGMMLALGGLRSVQAASGDPGVSGTGTIIDQFGTTQVISVSASVDGSGVATGSFSIISNPPFPGGQTPSSSFVNCLVVSGNHAVVGATLNFPSGSPVYGLVFITDNTPVGQPDTMWLNPPSNIGPGTCAEAPTGTEEPLLAGDFSVVDGAVATGTPQATTPAVTQPPTATDPGTPAPTIPGGGGTPGPTPADANGDGIIDTLQPAGTPAGSFFDGSLTPPTFGSIVATNGLSVSISDSPDPAVGVIVTVGSEVPGAQVQLSTCTGGFIVYLDAGTTTSGTCGSITLGVTSGRASIVLGGGLTVVTISTSGIAKVAANVDGSYSVTNLGTTGAPAVSLTVDGSTATVNPGTSTVAEPWDFVGFGQPIDNGAVLNRVKAGQAIPVKWRILDRSGLPILTLASARITVGSLSCASGSTIDQIEEVASGSSGLQNLGNGYYQVNWKSPTTYANSCKTMHLDIGDGVAHDALFQFTK